MNPTSPDASVAPNPVVDRPGRFRYHDGNRVRFGDPLKIQLRLAGACPGGNILALNEPLAEIDPPEGEARPDVAAFGKAAETLDPVIAVGFDLPPFDESTGAGLTLIERVGLLTGFLRSVAVSDAPGEGDESADQDSPEAVRESQPAATPETA